jgi:hypothetical protein
MGHGLRKRGGFAHVAEGKSRTATERGNNICHGYTSFSQATQTLDLQMI